MSNNTRKTGNLISELSYNYLYVNTDKNDPQYGTLKLTSITENHTDPINIASLDVYSDYIGFGTFFVNSDGFLVSVLNLG